MAVIHRTTMTPGKIDLLADWLPAQPWYAAPGRRPELAKAGGFRLDDPAGEVGLEFMVVTDASGGAPTAYHVPLTYRGAPLEGAGHALVGTSEHGVLGRRWIYDGVHDPVLVAQVLALLRGDAEPQAQSETDTPDRTVTVHGPDAGSATGAGAVGVTEGPHGTDLVLRAAGEGTATRTLTVTRVLRPGQSEDTGHPDDPGPSGARSRVTAAWHLPDGAETRGTFLALAGAG